MPLLSEAVIEPDSNPHLESTRFFDRGHNQSICPECGSTEVVDSTAASSTTRCQSCGFEWNVVESNESYSESDLVPKRFELIRVLGQGAFGCVWEGFDHELDRKVAIKVPRRHLSHSAIESLIRESRAAANLDHPNIVGVFDVGTHRDLFYIVCRLVEGTDLAKWLKANRITPDESVDVLCVLCDALQHAHENGVIHRDLKPSNILIEQDGQLWVTDFGLAKQLDAEVTATADGQVLGTPAYMSPEQAAGQSQKADARSDVYSLGVIFYELLTGERPFRGSVQSVLVSLASDEPTSPRRLRPGIPADLETICLKCLEKNPSQRFQSASQLKDELDRYRLGVPILSRPIGWHEKSWKWCKRNPLVATSLISTLLILVIGLTTTSMFWWSSLVANKDLTKANTKNEKLIGEIEGKNATLLERSKQLATQSEIATRRADELERKFFYSGLDRSYSAFREGKLKRASSLLSETKAINQDWAEDFFVANLQRQLATEDWIESSPNEILAKIPNSATLLTQTRDQWNVWDYEKRIVLRSVKKESNVSKVNVSRSGKRAVGLILPRTLITFDLDNLDNINRLSLPFDVAYNNASRCDVKWLPDEKHLAITQMLQHPNGIGKTTKKLLVFNLETQKIKAQWEVVSTSFEVFGDAILALTKGTDDKSFFVSLLNPDEPNAVIPKVPFENAIEPVRWHDIQLLDDNYFVVYSSEEAHCFMKFNHRLLKRWRRKLDEPVSRVLGAVGEKTHSLLVQMRKDKVEVWDLRSGETRREIPFQKPKGSLVIRSVPIEDGQRLVYSNGSQLVCVPIQRPINQAARYLDTSRNWHVAWRPTTGSTQIYIVDRVKEEQARIQIRGMVFTGVLHPDLPLMAVVLYDRNRESRSLAFLDLEKKEIVKHEFGVQQNIAHLRLSEDGKQLMVFGEKNPRRSAGSPTGALEILNFETGEVQSSFGNYIVDACFIHDGQQVALLQSKQPFSSQNRLSIYEVKTGTKQRDIELDESPRCVSSDPVGGGFFVGTVGGNCYRFAEGEGQATGNYRCNSPIEAVHSLGEDYVLTLEGNNGQRKATVFDRVSKAIVLEFPNAASSGIPLGDPIVRKLWVSQNKDIVRFYPPGIYLGRGELQWPRAINDDLGEWPPESMEKLKRQQRFKLTKVDSQEVLKQLRDSVKAGDNSATLTAFRKWIPDLRRRAYYADKKEREELQQSTGIAYYLFADWAAGLPEMSLDMLRLWEKPVPAYKRAIRHWEYPQALNRNYGRTMEGGLKNNLARYYMRTDRPHMAPSLLEEAIALQRVVLKAEPENGTARSFLVNHYTTLIQALCDRGKAFESVKPFSDLMNLEPSKPTDMRRAAEKVPVMIAAAIEEKSSQEKTLAAIKKVVETAVDKKQFELDDFLESATTDDDKWLGQFPEWKSVEKTP